jgi:hypothetical protein
LVRLEKARGDKETKEHVLVKIGSLRLAAVDTQLRPQIVCRRKRGGIRTVVSLKDLERSCTYTCVCVCLSRCLWASVCLCLSGFFWAFVVSFPLCRYLRVCRSLVGSTCPSPSASWCCLSLWTCIALFSNCNENVRFHFHCPCICVWICVSQDALLFCHCVSVLV